MAKAKPRWPPSSRAGWSARTKCTARLLKVGDTRLIFTSREPLPAPFAAEQQRRELHQLHREDSVKLVERALNVDATPVAWDRVPSSGRVDARDKVPSYAEGDTAQEEIEQLVDAVHCHARTLALLAPALRGRGVEKTRASLVHLMQEMERRFPGSREQSVFASVELSLQRISPANQDRAHVLGVFHGGVWLPILQLMMQWEEADVDSLTDELIATGLATPNRYNHFTLNPALCPCLRAGLYNESNAGLQARESSGDANDEGLAGLETRPTATGSEAHRTEMSPGRRARSCNWGTCIATSWTAGKKLSPFTGKPQTSMLKSVTERMKGRQEAISLFCSESCVAWTRRDRKSSVLSNASPNSATPLSRGNAGKS